MTTHHQDLSTHAMTEVALGLSMAFFALLVVVLVTFHPSHRASMDVTVADEGQSQHAQPPLLVLYAKGQFIDTALQPVAPPFDAQRPLVVAIMENTPFEQVMAIKTRTAHPQVSMTLMSPEWQARLATW